jgi:hypothetical protein
VLSNKLGDDFGVGIALKDHTLTLKLTLEDGVILDDAVVDDGDQAITGDMRVGIAIHSWPVGGPTRMADAMTTRGGTFTKELNQIGNSAGTSPDMQVSAGYGGNAGTIVAPVFQPSKPFNQDGLGFSRPDITDNAAHPGFLLKCILTCISGQKARAMPGRRDYIKSFGSSSAALWKSAVNPQDRADG